MEAKHKELLLKDLCARLPYGVKGNFQNSDDELLRSITIMYRYLEPNGMVMTGDVKPYLFPLSSMTEKQIEEYEDALAYHDYVKGGWTLAKTFENEYIIPYWFVDFCNKHHLDYRGLIPMGLAIDATNLNIY
jgi:hypothetical protein